MFALITNLVVSSLLVLGGSAVITAVTGMNVYAASMLIPISVLLVCVPTGLAKDDSIGHTGNILSNCRGE